MWKLVERAVGAAMNAHYAKTHVQQAPLYANTRIGTDTVVFVHGLHGHILETWGKFPEFLANDSELPHLDILMWGYRASVFPGVLPIAKVGEALTGFVREQTELEARIFFVGHSMGGLVILRGLCDEAKEGRARQRPASRTRHVHLYATPSNGSEVAGAIAATVGFLPRVGHFIAGHLKELRRGVFCDTLMGDVVEHIYRPRIDPGDENRKVEIPIKAMVAERDLAVTETAAKAIFKHPAPVLVLGATHTSVKEPEKPSDLSYRAFRESLVPHYTRWFHDLSVRAIDQKDPIAQGEVLQRCREPAVLRLQSHHPIGGGSAVSDERVQELLAIAMLLAKDAQDLRLGRALDLALDELVRHGR